MYSFKINAFVREMRESCQVMPEQPRTLDRARLVDGPLATLERDEMARVERALLSVLGLA